MKGHLKKGPRYERSQQPHAKISAKIRHLSLSLASNNGRLVPLLCAPFRASKTPSLMSTAKEQGLGHLNQKSNIESKSKSDRKSSNRKRPTTIRNSEPSEAHLKKGPQDRIPQPLHAAEVDRQQLVNEVGGGRRAHLVRHGLLEQPRAAQVGLQGKREQRFKERSTAGLCPGRLAIVALKVKGYRWALLQGTQTFGVFAPLALSSRKKETGLEHSRISENG